MSIIVARSGVVISSILGLTAAPVANGQPVASQFKLQTERVVIFKDGVAWLANRALQPPLRTVMYLLGRFLTPLF